MWGTLAALGVSIPILLHLLNKARPKKVNWAAMELLQKTTQRQAKKIKLEDWLLMLLRSLTLLLAALAMMRLVLVNASDLFSGSSRELIVAIDASYSMNHGPYESRFERAKKKAMKLIESLPSGSRLSLIAIGSQADVLIRHKDPSKLSMERYLSSLRVKPERFELEASLSAIEELVDESDLANREVIFLTDGQKRGWEGNSPSITERFAELSKKASISVLPLFEESHENLSVSDFHMASG
ncbi:MAG: BatA domain-containing protein, partial [Verrucomicrobiota bacterium]|nr:BatA domain-containing protein [Verrucomicrobiota bacterium]